MVQRSGNTQPDGPARDQAAAVLHRHDRSINLRMLVRCPVNLTDSSHVFHQQQRYTPAPSATQGLFRHRLHRFHHHFRYRRDRRHVRRLRRYQFREQHRCRRVGHQYRRSCCVEFRHRPRFQDAWDAQATERGLLRVFLLPWFSSNEAYDYGAKRGCLDLRPTSRRNPLKLFCAFYRNIVFWKEVSFDQLEQDMNNLDVHFLHAVGIGATRATDTDVT